MSCDCTVKVAHTVSKETKLENPLECNCLMRWTKAENWRTSYVECGEPAREWYLADFDSVCYGSTVHPPIVTTTPAPPITNQCGQRIKWNICEIVSKSPCRLICGAIFGLLYSNMRFSGNHST